MLSFKLFVIKLKQFAIWNLSNDDRSFILMLREIGEKQLARATLWMLLLYFKTKIKQNILTQKMYSMSCRQKEETFIIAFVTCLAFFFLISYSKISYSTAILLIVWQFFIGIQFYQKMQGLSFLLDRIVSIIVVSGPNKCQPQTKSLFKRLVVNRHHSIVLKRTTIDKNIHSAFTLTAEIYKKIFR